VLTKGLTTGQDGHCREPNGSPKGFRFESRPWTMPIPMRGRPPNK
jgi:hypothetical protein